MNYPRLYEPILLSLLAALALLLATRQEKWPDWLRAFLIVVGLVFLVWAVFTTIDVMVFRANMRLRERQMALARTERVMMLEQLKQLNRMQIEALSQYTPVYELVGGDTKPLMYLRVFGGTVPAGFVDEFLRLGDEAHLCPVSRWSEGTREREWAEQFTRYAIAQGWATKAAGPYPAKWKNLERAYQALGYEVVYEEK
jgi:hypothetical protein